jgi:hypothetical protein
MILLVGLCPVAVTHFHVWILVKFGWIFLITAFLIVKSLWVKHHPPQGIAIRRTDAPALFDLIEEVRQSAGGLPYLSGCSKPSMI